MSVAARPFGTSAFVVILFVFSSALNLKLVHSGCSRLLFRNRIREPLQPRRKVAFFLSFCKKNTIKMSHVSDVRSLTLPNGVKAKKRTVTKQKKILPPV